jgi:hypothetical protein
MFQMMGVFAEFERAMIRERVKSGIERARAQGIKFGRPRIAADKEAAIRTALEASGVGIIKLAKLNEVGVAAVQRIKASLAPDARLWPHRVGSGSKRTAILMTAMRPWRSFRRSASVPDSGRCSGKPLGQPRAEKRRSAKPRQF